MEYLKLAKKVIAGKAVFFEEARALINCNDGRTFELLAAANIIKQYYKGNKVKLCSIVNAKAGQCSENCTFCAQSARHQTKLARSPLLSTEQMLAAAKAAEKKMQATCFSIVTSGKAIKAKKELEAIASAVKNIKDNTNLNRCVSIGTLGPPEIRQLKAAGLARLHHNLETAESFFDQVCTTHSYAERLNTIKAARQAGVDVCSGGIFGLGESPEQRLELAFTLKELGVVSVPINILNPIPGTPAAEKCKPLPPLEVLRLVATYRFILPTEDIGVFGGREKALGSLQPLMFLAGANVTLIGDYLTTKGQAPDKDLQMIADLGLEIDKLPPLSFPTIVGFGHLPLIKREKERG